MVGAPGSGKSTLAKQIQENYAAVIINGDEIREELYGDASIQGEWLAIQGRMEELIVENLGSNLVIDNTHYLSEYRRESLGLLAMHGYNKVYAVVVDKPLEVCLAQNKQRQRQVPEHVIREMHSKIVPEFDIYYNEGFYNVHIIN